MRKGADANGRADGTKYPAREKDRGKIGIELERTRELRAYMRNKNVSFDKAYDDLSNLFGFPEIEREIYRAKCNFW